MGTTFDNAYIEMKIKLRVKAVSLGMAFRERQLNEMTDKFGLTESDFERVIFLGSVRHIRICDRDAFYNMLDGFEKEKQQAIAEDKTGDGFIRDMFYNELELSNYWNCYYLQQALDALGLTVEQIKANKQLLRGFRAAEAEYLKNYD